jgi:hypothetical protein
MRKGAALAAVLFAVAMTSAMAVGGAYVARQQASHARFAMRSSSILPATEEALATAMAGWDSVAQAEQPIGSELSVPVVSQPGIATRVWITRTDNNLYWLVAESESLLKPTLRRRLGVLVHVSAGAPAPVPLRAWVELP